MRSIGVNLTEDQIDSLDDIKREWDRREAGTVSRSEVAREAMAVGLVALEGIDKRASGLNTRERKTLVRQAILDHFREE